MQEPEFFEPETHRHDIQLRDIRDGDAVVSYNTVTRGRTITERRHVSTRLPFECLTVFRDGTVDVDDLTAEERAWITAESEPNVIDFEGVGA